MLWTIAAPFLTPGSHWIDDFAPASDYTFRKVPPPHGHRDDWHRRKTRATPLGRWADHWRHAAAALEKADGVVTVFPQLAATVNFRRRIARNDVPVVAWCYNVGRFPTGPKRALVRSAMSGISRVIVHSRAEVALVSDFLGVDEGVVQFVPLQRAPIPVLEPEETTDPFVVAMGSANRDYATLFEAARRTRLPLTVVASPIALEGLAKPDNVTVLGGLSAEQCWRLAQRARFGIVPLAATEAASGQVTVIEGMRMDRAVIATQSIGTEDYIEDEVTGLLTPANDPAALADRMTRLWDDAALRRKLADAATTFAEVTLSDQAAGAALLRVLREAAATRGQA